MLADGDQDLSSHVTALLGSWGLVFNMDTSSSLLDEKLGKLHNGSQTAMSSISIGNDWSEVVNVLQLAAGLSRSGGDSFFALLSVVEELCHEEMLNLVWNSSLVDKVRKPLSHSIVGKNIGYLHMGNQPNLGQARL